MSMAKISRLSILMGATFLVVGLVFEAPVHVDQAEKGMIAQLNKEEKMINYEGLFYAGFEDVDNDGKKEVVIALIRCKLPLWRGHLPHDIIDFAELAHIPLEGDLLVGIYDLRKGEWQRVKEIELAKEIYYFPPELEMKIGDFNKDGLNEIFFWAPSGNASLWEIWQFKGNKGKILGEGPEDRAEVELKDIDGDGVWEILEKAPTWHIATVKEQETVLKGHVYAIRILKWSREKQKWIFWKLVPDSYKERKLTKEELFNTPGAEELLKDVPYSELTKIYPLAF